ncbi:hypothetical protein FC18_GL002029 [Lacticaseibacillus sharpeae JCM 1186 = DSM 20505]|uniref:Uncharacterized protein n=1 Tax=Lacticaseibacillus sharpeae JCM 1186 = DSM 20505 TaxID=1291052 RepID=A0A0R1ZPX6_9LACO|nr:hypothetical protein FC18_GL002029 [Lacticaseibacillus sharpeae JCM 1186 = DSM 20505]
MHKRYTFGRQNENLLHKNGAIAGKIPYIRKKFQNDTKIVLLSFVILIKYN